MNDSPEFHEDSIEETRARIDARLNQLSGQLTPAGLLTAIVGRNGESASKLGATAVETARDKPLAAALVGAGIVGLIMAGRPEKSTKSPPSGPRRYAPDTDGDPAGRAARRTTEIRKQVNEMTNDIQESISEFSAAARRGAEQSRKQAEEIGETVSGYAGRAAKVAAETPDYVRRQSGAVADGVQSGLRSAGHAIETGKRQSQDGAARIVDWARANPVPVGLLAFAAGAVAASVLTAKRVPASKSAALQSSRKLHRAARKHEVEPDNRGAERFQDFQRAAEPDLSASNANRPADGAPGHGAHLPTPDEVAKADTESKGAESAGKNR